MHFVFWKRIENKSGPKEVTTVGSQKGYLAYGYEQIFTWPFVWCPIALQQVIHFVHWADKLKNKPPRTQPCNCKLQSFFFFIAVVANTVEHYVKSQVLLACLYNWNVRGRFGMRAQILELFYYCA